MFMRSLARHLNSTAVYAPDDPATPEVDETLEVEGGDAGGIEDPSEGSGEGEGEKRLSVREQLKKSMAEVAEADKGREPKKREAKSGRFADKQQKDQQPDPAQQQQAQQVAAPESLPKEAKADWANTPPSVQAAFMKREQDMQAGVDQLKGKYALIDQAIAPHTDALRQMNATPGEAVNRMFLWFKALAGNPLQAFPELAKNMGIDWNKLAAPQQVQQQPGQQQPGQEQQQQPAATQTPEYLDLARKFDQLAAYTQQVAGRFGGVEQSLQAQNEARTRENLSIWSNGKPYFEEVRRDMAKLIETGVVPLKPDGQVDLDTAYERAIYFNPEVRVKVLAEQQQANQQVQEDAKQAATTAQQTQATAARKRAVSIPASNPPGSVQKAPAKKPGQRTSVRDSLRAAISELRDQ